MAVRIFSWAWCLLLVCVHALPQLRHAARDENSAPVPAWNACGDLIRKASAEDNPYGVVNASDVYDCWATVPFNSAVATRFLKYWRDTLQFQSSLEWLKNPPEGFQKPAVDLIAGLDQIQKTVDANGYSGEYEFEADFQRLLYSANDDHVNLVAGVLSSFSFANPYGLTTLSSDGVALPKTYTTDDLYLYQAEGNPTTWQPSAITQINGQDVTEYLSAFGALNSGGTLEPHADWNTLVDNPVLDVLLDYTAFQGSVTFYPGDQFTFKFENGTEITDKWLAIYNDQGDTGPLETGGDFYNFFVLGFYPASYNPPNTTTTDNTSTTSNEPAPTSFSNYTIAYPDHPDVYQANLTITGFTTGYFFQDASLAVLSIPTFDMNDEAIQEFSDAVQQFVDKAKAAGMQKVVIDLQENTGGDVILAYNTFKQFFPSLTPFGGSDRRSFSLANTLGSTITGYCSTLQPSDPDYLTCTSDEWDALVVINAATGGNFTSWAELYGPTFDGRDNVTLTQRLDTQNPTYDYVNLGDVNPPAPLSATNAASPWAASDIIILSDALCSSACSLFLEFMRFDAGVRNVVIGGRPTEGPMQTPSLSRAARYYSLFEMDTDFANVVAIDPSAVVPNRNDQSLFIIDGGISIRDQLGPNSEIPYEMQYQAADCRIFLTPDTFNNFTNLWHYAADAIWTNPGHCVQGSTGHGPSGASSSMGPAQSIPAGVSYDSYGILDSVNNSAAHHILGVHDGPQPDAAASLPHRPRPQQETLSSESDPTNLKNTQTTYTTTEVSQEEKKGDYAICKLHSSDRASQLCARSKSSLGEPAIRSVRSKKRSLKKSKIRYARSRI